MTMLLARFPRETMWTEFAPCVSTAYTVNDEPLIRAPKYSNLTCRGRTEVRPGVY